MHLSIDIDINSDDDDDSDESDETLYTFANTIIKPEFNAWSQFRFDVWIKKQTVFMNIATNLNWMLN
jgi:hypothetical protein